MFVCDDHSENGAFLLILHFIFMLIVSMSVLCYLMITCLERTNPLTLLCIVFSCVLTFFDMFSVSGKPLDCIHHGSSCLILILYNPKYRLTYNSKSSNDL